MSSPSPTPPERIDDPTDDLRPTMRYQPALDGLRCLGVISVICAHLSAVQPKLTRFGCYMFVDMFFVMSGFLITAPLLRERRRNGRVSLRGFYVRRFARVYPIIALVLVAAITQRLVRPMSAATPSTIGIIGIAAYFANFVQIFKHSDALSAWAPLWSLSIEEQYYALWPFALLVLLGRSSRTIRPLVLVSGLTVAMWIGRAWAWQAIPHTPDDPSATLRNLTDAWHVFYYSTFQRPDGLLIGSALALVLADPASRAARYLARFAHAVRWLAIGGLAVIVYQTASGHAPWQVQYGLALFNVLMTLLIVELLYHPDSRLSTMLSTRWMTWVGRRCYFIYAVHLAAFMLVIDGFGWTSAPRLAATTGVVLFVAGLSYRFYEEPIRRWGYRASARILESDTRRNDHTGAEPPLP